MTVNVRPPETQDAAGMGVVHVYVWSALCGKFIDPKYPGRFDEAVLVDQWHRLLTSDPAGRRIAIVVEHGRVIGVVMTVPTIRTENVTPPARDREVSVHYLMPEYQGRGIGRRLLEYAIGPREPAQLRLPSGYEGERRARRIYQRAGFLSDGAVTGREVNYGLTLNRMVR